MAYELSAALRVIDETVYSEYRAEIQPLLAEAGARFRCDCDISRVRQPSGRPHWNRWFVLSFPDSTVKEAFFADVRYRAIRAQYFPRCVGEFVTIAEYRTEKGDSDGC